MKNTFSFATLWLGILMILFSKTLSAQSPPVAWAKQLGGPYTRVSAMATDPSGNLYSACIFGPTLSIGSQTVYGSGYMDICVLKTDPLGNLIWYKVISGGTGHYLGAMACDSKGDVYLTGYFQGNALFGSQVLVNAGSSDIFVTKISSTGNFRWSKRMGGSDLDVGTGICLSSTDELYVSGSFENSATFGSTNLNTAGLTDLFVTKLDTSNGSPIWIKRLGSTHEETGASVAVSPAGNVVVSGQFSVSTVLGTSTLSSMGFNDLFLVSLDGQNGAVQWTRQVGSNGDDQPSGLCADNNGDVYFLGQFSGVLSQGSQTLISSGISMFLLKSNGSSGYPCFIKNYLSSSGNDGLGRSVIFAAPDKILLTGWFNSNFSYGTTTLSSNGSADAFLAECDTLGTIQWAANNGGSNQDYGYTVAADAYGTIYTGGYFSETVIYGPTILSAPNSHGNFIARWGTATVPTSLQNATVETRLLTLFPNPFNEELYFATPPKHAGQLTIVDLCGKEVFRAFVNPLSRSVTVPSALPAGFYYALLETEEGQRSLGKIVKK